MDNELIGRPRIVNIARQELGIKESPSGSNLTKFGEWYGQNGVAWCGIFVSWVYFFSGYPLGHIDSPKGYASCQDGYNHFKANGELTQDPQPGDIVFYDWNIDGHADHTGIFERWEDDKKQFFFALEGNTSFGNNSDGGEVMERRRGVSVVKAFASPKIIGT